MDWMDMFIASVHRAETKP